LEGDSVAGDGSDDALGIDAADAEVQGVGEVEIALGVEAGEGGLVERGVGAGPPSPENPVVPLPARVSMVPSGRMRWITLEVWSQRTMLPAGSNATPASWVRETS
jgi:hypothetical protein